MKPCCNLTLLNNFLYVPFFNACLRIEFVFKRSDLSDSAGNSL
jgi:hypothetical protein